MSSYFISELLRQVEKAVEARVKRRRIEYLRKIIRIMSCKICINLIINTKSIRKNQHLFGGCRFCVPVRMLHAWIILHWASVCEVNLWLQQLLTLKLLQILFTIFLSAIQQKFRNI